MDKGNSKNSWLLDITSLLAVLLPLAQISFIYLPDGLKSIYIQQQTFLGISLVTLVMSYISIVAYKARPWFTFVFPFHKKKMEDYNAWQQKMYQASAAMNFVSGEQASQQKITKFLKNLEAKSISRPFQINTENRIGIFLGLLFVNALAFLVLGLTGSTGWMATLQSLNYFFMIILAVLILIIYRDTTNNNRRYNDDLKLSTPRAIELAIRSNCFTPQPQIKFISTHGGEGVNNNFVRVEFDGEQYEICTNPGATKLIYCLKLDPQN
jgi:hypothetical protein